MDNEPRKRGSFLHISQVRPFQTSVPNLTRPYALNKQPVCCHAARTAPTGRGSRKGRDLSPRIAEFADALIRIALPFLSRGTLITFGFIMALLLWENLFL